MDATAHRKRLLLRVLKSETEYLVRTGAVNGDVQLLVFLFCDGEPWKRILINRQERLYITINLVRRKESHCGDSSL